MNLTKKSQVWTKHFKFFKSNTIGFSIKFYSWYFTKPWPVFFKTLFYIEIHMLFWEIHYGIYESSNITFS